MSMIFAASRASLRAAQAPSMALRRSLHIENTVENVRSYVHSLPFKASKKNKGKVAFGVSAFFVTGLSLPVVAGLWQLNKQ
ncbi:ethanolamine transporter [Malassezia pachydermatis]|uniref:Cytochrome c oxidase subunit 8, mitochondrial n=1 Tax=Malassezia pachydermatis TaxID=77020 RepID=A0A0M9VPS0_9BASI|nr:ethanolamine transporter [Malassezia pachydermatis]KOS14762.1 ethanolamine transporter [Malassezia pachydermatis]